MDQPTDAAGGLAGREGWHALEAEVVMSSLGTSHNGLSEEEAASRLSGHGHNVLSKGDEVKWWRVALEEITEPMIILLLIIGVLYSILGEPEDAVTIFAVIIALVAVEVRNELKAKKTIRALNVLSQSSATMVRGGRERDVPVEDMVPGDIIILDGGRRVPADARIIESRGLAVDESSLTGEPVPVEKNDRQLENVALAERSNMIYSGTLAVRGQARAVVVATGMSTELGHIATLARKEKPPRTVLQLAMKDLTKWMVVLAVAFSALVPVLAWLINGENPQTMVLTALSLAFATIPEELPIIITMMLALGGYRLSRQQAVVKKLQAVESLGAVTVICTDKTGTLTENRLEVREVVGPRTEVLTLAALANHARVTSEGFAGDPADVAILAEASEAGIDIVGIRARQSVVSERPFDSALKRMSVTVTGPEGRREIVKGSPEGVLSICTHHRRDGITERLDDGSRSEILGGVEEMAARGLRVLGVAEGTGSEMAFVGLIGLLDPPRREARQAIDAVIGAGIRPVMVTGDHPLTAREVAGEVGLPVGRMLTGEEVDGMDDGALGEAIGTVGVFARTTPEQKLRIVKAFRARGDRIAVTGDGINDAPALAAADIGIAMGQGGTDVARESADMVLMDNNFDTIARAVSEGRKLFANLTKGVRYYLACKVALISVTLAAVLMHLDVPFTPLQIILLELFMDLGASAAFVAERAERDIMRLPPRDPRRPFLDRRMVASVFVSATGLFAAVFIAYYVAWSGSGDLVMAQTAAFVTWLFTHVLLAFNMRSERQPMYLLGPLSNRTMALWAASAMVFAVLVTEVPFLHGAIKTTFLPPEMWALIIGLAIAGSFWMELVKVAVRRD
jgi:Ca2+-transporting ATPase